MSFSNAPNFGNYGAAGGMGANGTNSTNGLDGGTISSMGANGGTPQSNFQAQLANQQNSGFTQQDYSNAIASGLAGQQLGLGQQQQLIGSLQGQMNGTSGPNLGQTQLNNATQQNLQTTAGQIGSINGINPADAARLISQNQTSAQQTSAGQSAVERQQQQLAAQQQLGQALASNVAGNQGLLSGGQAGNAQNLQNYQYAEGLNQQTAAQNTAAATQGQGQQAALAGTNSLLSTLAGPVGGLLNSGGGGLASMFGGGSGAAGAGAGAAGGVADAGAISGGLDAADFGVAALAFSGGGMVTGKPTPPGVDSVPAMLRVGEQVIPEEIVKLGPHAVAAYSSRLARLVSKHRRN